MNRKLPPMNALKAFEAVGQTGSFTRAAEVMNQTQSALSRQVKLLEDILEVQLFHREYHKLTLTQAGQALLPVLRQSFDNIQQVVRRLNEGSVLTSLRTNLPPTFAVRWFAPRLGDLRKVFPMIDISVTSRMMDNVEDDEGVDCAVRFGDGEWPGVDAKPLMQERLVAVCSPWLLKDQDPISLLRNNTLLHLLNGNVRYLSWDKWLAAAGIDDIDPNHGVAFDTQDLTLASARSGFGIAIADEWMIDDDLASGRLVKLLDVHYTASAYWFVTRKRDADKPYLALFYNWLKEAIAIQQETLHGQ